MFKLISIILILTFTVNVKPQFSRIFDILNNVTVSDLAKVLRWLPIPNPMVFDGLPLKRNDVIYFLYTRANPNDPQILKQYSTRLGNLDPTNEVKFLVHGWLEDANRTYYTALTDAYLRRGDYNVIGVDWSRPAMNEYSIASRNTKTAGRELGDFIIRLNKIAGIPMENFHILGHSLGAHMAGFAGKRVWSRTGRKIGRISALDAAGPLFEIPLPVSRKNRLDRNDADFVDCIHTDGGVFGMVQPIGHADFYPNGGLPRQPGCYKLNIAQLSSRVIIDDLLEGIIQTLEHSSTDMVPVLKPVFCSHYRSHQLYTESINSKMLLGTQCNSYENYRSGQCIGGQIESMGEDADKTARGKFYLYTNGEEPYART